MPTHKGNIMFTESWDWRLGVGLRDGEFANEWTGSMEWWWQRPRFRLGTAAYRGPQGRSPWTLRSGIKMALLPAEKPPVYTPPQWQQPLARTPAPFARTSAPFQRTLSD